MYERPRKPSDPFPDPFPNEQAARLANSGAYPPDLSLMVEARPGGADYVYALLTGYKEAPEGVEGPKGKYYNKFYPSHWIAMAPPLSDGLVSYDDGTKATTEQMAHDVTAFLAWAAEPNMETRKRTGVRVLIFLVILSGLFYASKKRVWARLKD